MVAELMEDLRHGESVKLKRVRQAVEALLADVLRDPMASARLAQLNVVHNDLAQRCVHVSIMSMVFALNIGIPRNKIADLALGALLCDVGMVRVPREIYEKHDSLTQEEQSIVHEHVDAGIDLLEKCEGMNDAVMDVVRLHHERYDGGGYPLGRRGREMPLNARIVQIVSVYIAMTSERPYARAISSKAALAEIYHQAGCAFDPILTQKFVRCIGIFPVWCVVTFNTGETGVVIEANSSAPRSPKVKIYYDERGRRLDVPRIIDLSEQPGVIEISRMLEPHEYHLEVNDRGQCSLFELAN